LLIFIEHLWQLLHGSQGFDHLIDGRLVISSWTEGLVLIHPKADDYYRNTYSKSMRFISDRRSLIENYAWLSSLSYISSSWLLCFSSLIKTLWTFGFYWHFVDLC
jgi:hypothetical protein